MKWWTILLIAVGVLAVTRIVMQLRRLQKAPADDWDARFISQLRKAGVAAFDEHTVDFFFALPGPAASAAVEQALRADSFTTDAKPDTDGAGYSVHASKVMRLNVPDMQALTLRLRQLAEEQGGTYDGWAVAKAKTS